METLPESSLKKLPLPTLSLRLESADLGLNLALLLSGPTSTGGVFGSGNLAIQKLLPALRSVGVCSAAYDCDKEAELQRFESALQRKEAQRREQHEFYSRAEARFVDMADTIQRMKRDYYREIDHLREQISRKRHDPEFEPDGSVVFFDPSSYRLPSWTEIVEELDGMRMKRELLEKELGSDRVKTVPIHMLCARCRGKFQSQDEALTSESQNSCDQCTQAGGIEDTFGECADVAMQTDWIVVDTPLAVGTGVLPRTHSVGVDTAALEAEIIQSKQAHVSCFSAGAGRDGPEIWLANAETVSTERMGHLLNTAKSVHSSISREQEILREGSLAEELPEDPDAEGLHLRNTSEKDPSVLAEGPGKGERGAQPFGAFPSPSAVDRMNNEQDGDLLSWTDSLARSHSSIELGGFLDEMPLPTEDVNGELMGVDLSTESITDTRQPGCTGVPEESGHTSTDVENGHSHSKEGVEKRALIMQERLEQVFSQDAKAKRSNALSRAKQGKMTKKQLAAARLARHLESIQKHLQRVAFGRLKGAGTVSRDVGMGFESPNGASLNSTSPAAYRHPESKSPAGCPEVGGLLGVPANRQQLAAPTTGSRQAPPIGARERMLIKHAHRRAAESLGSSSSAAGRESCSSPSCREPGNSLRNRNLMHPATALDVDLLESLPQTPTPAFSSRPHNWSPMSRSWGEPNSRSYSLSSVTLDGIGAIKAQSAKSSVAAMRLHSEGLPRKAAGYSTCRPGMGSSASTGTLTQTLGLPLLAKGRRAF